MADQGDDTPRSDPNEFSADEGAANAAANALMPKLAALQKKQQPRSAPPSHSFTPRSRRSFSNSNAVK
jgi:hypothetical protein